MRDFSLVHVYFLLVHLWSTIEVSVAVWVLSRAPGELDTLAGLYLVFPFFLMKADLGDISINMCAAMSNVQEPLRKLATCRRADNTHVATEMEDLDMRPESRTAEGGTNDLFARSLDNDGQDLLVVTAKDDSDASEGPWVVPEIL